MKASALVVLLLLILVAMSRSMVSAQEFDSEDLHIEEEPASAGDDYEEEGGEAGAKERIPSQRVHPLTDIPEPSPSVSFHVVFPEDGQNELSLPLGHPVTILVGLVNSDSQPVNVSFVMGSLNSDELFSNYIQNFTKRDLNSTLPGFSEMTVSYRFATYYDLEPNKYQLALTVFYETESDEYATTFFNGTVSFYEKRTSFDFRVLYSLVILTSLIGALIFIFCGGKSPSKKRSAPVAPRDDTDEWLSETLAASSKPKSD